MSVVMRQEVERKIVTAFIKAANEAGYTFTVDYGDGESSRLRGVKPTLEAMFQGDEDRIYLHKDGKYFGWAYFVYGNDGWDVLSDYTVNLEPLMTEANKISDHYGAR